MLHSPTDYIDCLRYAGECCCNTISLPLETKALESSLAYIAASGDCIFTQMLITLRRKLPKLSAEQNGLAWIPKRVLKAIMDNVSHPVEIRASF